MTNTGIYIDLERYGLILQFCLLKTSRGFPHISKIVTTPFAKLGIRAVNHLTQINFIFIGRKTYSCLFFIHYQRYLYIFFILRESMSFSINLSILIFEILLLRSLIIMVESEKIDLIVTCLLSLSSMISISSEEYDAKN